MNLQQLRYVREAVRRQLNLTDASSALHTSQSGISKQIRELELELGAQIFVRKGKRLTGLTAVGTGVVKLVEQILTDIDKLRSYPGEFKGQHASRLVISTTHNQARYTLPGVISRFTKQFPDVQLELRQGTPAEAARSVQSGEADIALATEALDRTDGLVVAPCFSWRHLIIVAKGHPLAKLPDVTLSDVAAWPLVTYCPDFAGRAQVDRAFARSGLAPEIRLAAMDAEDIKEYVAQDLGVGVISEMAVSPNDNVRLTALPQTLSLFEPSISRIAVRQGALLPSFGLRFIELLAPHLAEDFAQTLAPGVTRDQDREQADKVVHFSRLATLHGQGAGDMTRPTTARPRRRIHVGGVITAH